ncbi:uncharacterized protein E0L32_007632 [Thyridium curvatum]|uniref:Carboxypeptidase n=1 Tax=Thyridium curvatum TaxID=1093900 RepID=A0A507AVA9_9PEZI|nr:uncharacterized protein E0L32_007632 [Thyridium curvatum]TPX11653.1 hypothetical protein E0L32_007632 [Thyridium curvatum]
MAQPRATAQNQIWTAPDLASLNFSGDCNLVNEFLHTWFNVDAGRLTNVPDHVADNATFWVPRSLSEIITDAYFRQALPQQERAIPTMGDILDWEYQQRVAYAETVNSIASNSTNATFANTFPTYFDLVINDPANACPFVACGLSPQADQMADLNGPGINIFILFQSFILAVFGLISVYESIMRLSGHPKACLIRLCACIQRALPSFAMALTISDIALPVALIVYYLRARDAGQIFYKDFILTLWLSVSLLSSSLLVCRVGACLRQVARLPVACPFQNSPQAPPKSQCFRSQLFVDKPKAWLLLKVLNTDRTRAAGLGGPQLASLHHVSKPDQAAAEASFNLGSLARLRRHSSQLRFGCAALLLRESSVREAVWARSQPNPGWLDLGSDRRRVGYASCYLRLRALIGVHDLVTMLMRHVRTFGLAALAALAPHAAAQFPKPPEGVTILKSKFNSNVTISYKETGLCETTEGVKSFSGYIHLPPGTLHDQDQDYPINTFFWFFESRKDPQNAPLSIWMNGGPGSSSMLGLLVENGPCFVNPDSNSTRLNEWSWNNEVNMLYLDQPVQVGLSYDTLANYTVNTFTGATTKLKDNEPIPEQNATFFTGTFPSNNRNRTSQGTQNAAVALWHFAQVWFQEFPGYHPNDSRISIATESYGGRYGPAFAAYFEEQNQKIENGTWHGQPGEMHILNLDTLLIINGCVDRELQLPFYPEIAVNNTYGIAAVNETIYKQMVDAWTKPGGCRDMINDCHAASVVGDPDDTGKNATVNKICSQAEDYCSTEVRGPYLRYSGRNYYDMTQLDPDPFPPPFYQGWLNQPHVQAGLGVPLNWTQSSGAVSAAFRGIGDYPRPGWLDDLAFLLENGIKVTLVYGDRDYACNWLGGEAVSRAINYTHTKDFNAAGYASIQTNASLVGGQVRQYGNLSFSRVYQAGHEVPSYQPDTAYEIFMRALFNKDIATGKVDTLANASYATVGSVNTLDARDTPPPQYQHFCYSLDEATCTEEEWKRLAEGKLTVKNWIVVDKNSTELFPNVVGSDSSTPTPSSGSSSTSTSRPSTGTPNAGVRRDKFDHGLLPAALVVVGLFAF